MSHAFIWINTVIFVCILLKVFMHSIITCHNHINSIGYVYVCLHDKFIIFNVVFQHMVKERSGWIHDL